MQIRNEVLFFVAAKRNFRAGVGIRREKNSSRGLDVSHKLYDVYGDQQNKN